MSKKFALNLWNRDFQLKVVYDCLSGEEVLDEQISALDDFVGVDTSKSLEQVKKYCLKENSHELGNNIENIFKYVIPHTIYIPRKQEKPTVAVLCNYKFDIEHGLAIVFEKGKPVSVCPQDDIL